MARKRKSVPARAKPAAVTEAAADASGSALGFAMHLADDVSGPEALAAITGLAELCDRAADHMALAHNLLVTHEKHTDTAAEHLDAALACLKQLLAEGEKRKKARSKAGAKAGEARSA